MKHTRTRLASALVVIALSSPIAQASFPHEVGQPPSSAAQATAGAALTANPAPPPIPRMDGQLPTGQLPTVVRPIVLDEPGGFDWADAGIGFAAAGGLVLLGAGSVVALRRHRRLGSAVH